MTVSITDYMILPSSASGGTGSADATLTYEKDDVIVSLACVKRPYSNAIFCPSTSIIGDFTVGSDPVVASASSPMTVADTAVFTFTHIEADAQWILIAFVLHSDIVNKHPTLSILGETVAPFHDDTSDIVEMTTGLQYLFMFGGLASVGSWSVDIESSPSQEVTAPYYLDYQEDVVNPLDVMDYDHLATFLALEDANVSTDGGDYIRVWSGVFTERVHTYRIRLGEQFFPLPDPPGTTTEHFEYTYRWPQIYDQLTGADPAAGLDLLEQRDQQLENFLRIKPVCGYGVFEYSDRWADMWDPNDLVATAGRLDRHDLEYESITGNVEHAVPETPCLFEYPTRWPQIMESFMSDRDGTIAVLDQRDVELEERLSACRCVDGGGT